MTQHSESAGATEHLEFVTGLELQGDHRIPAKQVWSWALWDWATQPFNSVILTFVFTALYLTSDAFLDPSVAALDENDPASVARLMKKMGQEFGDDLGEDFESAVDEAMAESENPDSMGDEDAGTPESADTPGASEL